MRLEPRRCPSVHNFLSLEVKLLVLGVNILKLTHNVLDCSIGLEHLLVVASALSRRTSFN
jgi:hypothetical protein